MEEKKKIIWPSNDTLTDASSNMFLTVYADTHLLDKQCLECVLFEIYVH